MSNARRGKAAAPFDYPFDGVYTEPFDFAQDRPVEGTDAGAVFRYLLNGPFTTGRSS